MAIEPDAKDWTWVLQRPCEECGFDVIDLDPRHVPRLVRDNVGDWSRILAGPGDVVTARPSPDRWSALEYACHVRDVFRLFDRRLGWMLDQDDPLFPNWDQDETAVIDRYGEQDPSAVAVELAEAGEGLARSFAAVTDEQWSRTGRRSDGARFTVDTFARYFVHDPVHHVDDVHKGFAALGVPEID